MRPRDRLLNSPNTVDLSIPNRGVPKLESITTRLVSHQDEFGVTRPKDRAECRIGVAAKNRNRVALNV